MSWMNLQIGKKKAARRTPKRYFDGVSDEWYERSLVRARKTTKRCSVAIHGCGHRRDLEGDSYQERKMKEKYSLVSE